MSVYTQEELRCPSCGHPQIVTVWSSLNTSLDPEAREALLNGDINMLACGKCGKKAFINTAFLYHDMALEFCVQYFPPESLDHDEFFGQFTPEGTVVADALPAKFAESCGYILRPHIVFTMSELVRYVQFRERLVEAGISGLPAKRKTSRRRQQRKPKPPSK